MKKIGKAESKISIESISLDDLQEFMESGGMKYVSPELNRYMHILDKVRGMHLRIDQYGNSEAIIAHLMNFEGLSRYKAKQVYQETLEYFYCDNIISKAAYQNIYADKLDKVINFSMMIMKDVNDAAKIAKIIVDAAKVRGLDQPDVEEIPDALYKAPVKVYATDAAALGLPKADRNKLKELIDRVPDLTEKERHRIYEEADILDFKLFKNEQEDPRKS